MARLPTFQDLGQAPSGNSGRRLTDGGESVFSGAQRAVVQAAGASGSGLQSVGKGLSDFGGSVAHYARNEADLRNDLNESLAKSSWLVNRANIDAERDKEMDIGVLKTDYPKRYEDALAASAETIDDPDRRQRFLTSHAADLNDLRLKSVGRADALYKDDFKAKSFDMLNSLRLSALKSGNSKDHAQALETMGQTVDKMADMGIVDRSAAGEYKNKWAKDFAHDWVLSQPAEQRLSIVKPIIAGTEAKTGFDFFTSKGWTPEQSAAIMGHLYHESGGRFDPNAINKGDGADGSDSIGIGQWNGERAKALKAFAASVGKPWNDLGAQLEFVQRELSGPEAKAAASLKGARSVDDATAAFLQYERPKGYEGGLDTAAGGSARLRAARTFFSQLKGGAAAPDTRLASLIPADVSEKIAVDAEREIAVEDRRRAAALRGEIAAVKGLIKDDTASIMQTGKEVADLTTARVAATMGPEAAAEFDAERGVAKDFYTQTHDFSTLPSDRLPARVEALRPASGSAGFAKRMEYFEKASKAASDIVRQRTDDPAGAADRLEQVAKLRETATFDQPESFQPLVRARMAAQEQLGIPEAYRSPITRDEAKQLWRTVSDAPENEKPDAIREMVGLVAKAYGDHADEALGMILRETRTNAAVREQAAMVLKKLTHGAPATAQDARAIDQAEALAASQKAVDGIGQGIDFAAGEGPDEMAARKMQAPRFPLPSDRAIESLRTDPQRMSSAFNAKFGPGAAEKVLSAYGR